MKNIFKITVNIFYTILLISVSVIVGNYTINLINTPDDLVALLGFVLTSFVLLMLVLVLSYIWIQINKQKETK